MSKYKKYMVCKSEVLGYRAGVVFKTAKGATGSGIVKAIKFPINVETKDYDYWKKALESYDDKEEAVRSLEKWVYIDEKCTVFMLELENAISKKRMGFIYCGDVLDYSRVIAIYLDRIRGAKAHVNIKAIEEYNNRGEAERSLEDFINEKGMSKNE